MEEEIKNNQTVNAEKEANEADKANKDVPEKMHNCYHCKYFRLYSAKLTEQSKKFDGFCSKRQKPKIKKDVCKNFIFKD